MATQEYIGWYIDYFIFESLKSRYGIEYKKIISKWTFSFLYKVNLLDLLIWKHHFHVTVAVLHCVFISGLRFIVWKLWWLLYLQLESGDTYSLVLYGAGAFVGIWLVSAIVGAVDSIPLVSSSYITSVRVCMSFETVKRK